MHDDKRNAIRVREFTNAIIEDMTDEHASRLLELIVQNTVEWLRVNGTMYTVSEFQISTQCGGTEVEIYPVDLSNAVTYISTQEMIDRYNEAGGAGYAVLEKVKAKIDTEELVVTAVEDSYSAGDGPLADHNRHMVHLRISAVNDEDLDTLVMLIAKALAYWSAMSTPYNMFDGVTWEGAYAKVYPHDDVPQQLMGMRCRILTGQDIPIRFGKYDQEETGTWGWRSVYVPPIRSTVGAVIAIHLDYHDRYENFEGYECEYCCGTGEWEDERYDEENDEFSYHMVECEECYGSLDSPCEDDEYVRWEDALGADGRYTFPNSHRPVGSAKLVWDDSTVDDRAQGVCSSYLTNWQYEWDNEHAPITHEEHVLNTLDNMVCEFLMCGERASYVSVTCNMGSGYGQTHRAMEYIASNKDMFEELGFTLVLPTGEATNPNENHHYIHGVILVRDPDDTTSRTGLIDFDNPCMIQGTLELDEVA